MSLPDDIVAAAAAAIGQSIPVKSVEKYESAFDHFNNWRKKKNVASLLNEEILLAYFFDHSQVWKPNTLWARWSMLKTMLIKHCQVNIGAYSRLKRFLSNKSKGYKPKKAKTLQAVHLKKFVTEASDVQYLFTKVALIFSVCGTCRCDELLNITFDEVHDYGDLFYVDVNGTKNNVDRKFVIGLEFYATVKKYISLRPEKSPPNRFFVQYRDGRCTIQPAGINAFYKQPKIVADFLRLDEAPSFTGHCFRRSSATILADAGADILTIKRAGGWKSDQVAQGYVDESITHRKKISSLIAGSVMSSPTTVTGKKTFFESGATRPASSHTSPLNANPRFQSSATSPVSSHHSLPPYPAGSHYTSPVSNASVEEGFNEDSEQFGRIVYDYVSGTLVFIPFTSDHPHVSSQEPAAKRTQKSLSAFESNDSPTDSTEVGKVPTIWETLSQEEQDFDDSSFAFIDF